MADKEYKDLTPKEKYDSAIEAEKAPWNPIKAAKELIVEKFGPLKKKNWKRRLVTFCALLIFLLKRPFCLIRLSMLPESPKEKN